MARAKGDGPTLDDLVHEEWYRQLAYLQFGGRDAKVSAYTFLRRAELWMENYKTNLALAKMDDVSLDLELKAGRARAEQRVLIVDRGPSLPKALPHVADFPGKVFVTDRALRAVVVHRVPDAVVNVDASHLCIPFLANEDVAPHHEEIVAVFGVWSHPLLVRLWTGPKAFVVPESRLRASAIAQRLIEETGLRGIDAGGNVMTLAINLAYELGYREVVLAGCDNGYPARVEPEHKGAQVWEVRARDAAGREHVAWTDEVYWSYTARLLDILGELRGLRLVNCTEGGTIYDERIEAMPLADFNAVAAGARAVPSGKEAK